MRHRSSFARYNSYFQAAQKTMAECAIPSPYAVKMASQGLEAKAEGLVESFLMRIQMMQVGMVQ